MHHHYNISEIRKHLAGCATVSMLQQITAAERAKADTIVNQLDKDPAKKIKYTGGVDDLYNSLKATLNDATEKTEYSKFVGENGYVQGIENFIRSKHNLSVAAHPEEIKVVAKLCFAALHAEKARQVQDNVFDRLQITDSSKVGKDYSPSELHDSTLNAKASLAAAFKGVGMSVEAQQASAAMAKACGLEDGTLPDGSSAFDDTDNYAQESLVGTFFAGITELKVSEAWEAMDAAERIGGEVYNIYKNPTDGAASETYDGVDDVIDLDSEALYDNTTAPMGGKLNAGLATATGAAAADVISTHSSFTGLSMLSTIKKSEKLVERAAESEVRDGLSNEDPGQFDNAEQDFEKDVKSGAEEEIL